MMNRLKTHLLTQHVKNYVEHPTRFNIFASIFCAALMLAWGGWALYLGWRTWQTGEAIVKGVQVTAQGSPVFYYAVIVGVVSLGSFAIDAALQYAMEGFLRMRRRWGRHG